MDTKETIKSWGWRIKKAGYNQSTFADEYEMSRSALSEYIAGKKDPSLKRFSFIESTLKDLGV